MKDMSKYEQIKDLWEDKFKRLTGIKRTTFEKMIELLKEQIQER